MTPDVPVHVTTGFTWTAGLVGLLNVLVGTALVAWIKNRAPMRQLQKDADEKLRDDLITRVEKLEGRLDKEREAHTAELATLHAEYDADMAVMRHRVNNLNTCFEAFLMMLQKVPEASEAVSAVTQMRDRQVIAETAEKARIEAAKIEAASRRLTNAP
jgi:uncharacterized protein YlxW (UPF0749 family)